MSRREEYEMKTEALLQPIVDEKGFELVDVERIGTGYEHFSEVDYEYQTEK